MKLITFSHSGQARLGLLLEHSTSKEGVLKQSVVALDALDVSFPKDMLTYLQAPDAVNIRIKQAVELLSFDNPQLIALNQVSLHQPVLRPGKILAIALNYSEHIEESNADAPPVQMWFNKQSTCANGPFDSIHLPKVSSMLDYEGELAIVIGKRCRHVSEESAHEVIAGYSIMNDVSVRDWQLRSPTFQIGKSFDTHGPFGPCMVTPDELGDPHNLKIKTWVNDELRQDSNTRFMIHNCFQQIAHLTQAFTLEPGDIIATGTPSGVGMAFKPPRYLKAGDKVKVAIEGIGQIENEVILEPDDFVAGP